MTRRRFSAALAVVFCWVAFAGLGQASTANLAPGFEALPKGASVLLVRPNLKVYTGHGAYRADWTETASMRLRAALLSRAESMGLTVRELTEAQEQAIGEVSALNGVVGQSIATHQYGLRRLPTKAEKLDWSLGEAVVPLREFSGADYALFTWIRNSQMNPGHGAGEAATALFTGALNVDVQIAHVSLVDLRTGRILWFDHLNRGGRDLTEPAAAAQTVDRLLRFFPSSP